MNHPTRPAIQLVLCALFLACASCLAVARIEPAAPDFALRNLNGDVVRLSSFRGHTVVLDFWAAWCPPCIVQVPSMRRLAEKYKRDGVVVLNINVLDERNVVEKFIAEHGYFGSEILLTTDESTMNAFGIEQFPSTIIVDERGRIVATFSGGAPDNFTKIEATVVRLSGSSNAQRRTK